MIDVHCPPLSRAKRLKAGTETIHDALDKRIMDGEPFRDRQRYGRFLAMQYQFHRDVDGLYTNAMLGALLPDLEGRRRLALIGEDMADLALAPPPQESAPVFGAEGIDLSTAFGWLYVAEGSNLGAAFLLKAAAGLGLNRGFGARHLAGHPDGRARHWRKFTTALDALELDATEEQRAIEGARAAFGRVRGLADAAFS